MPSLEDVDAYLWSQLPDRIDSLVEKCAAPAWDIRPKIGNIYTRNHVGYYWNPYLEKAAIHCRPVVDVVESSLCKTALDSAVGCDHVQSEVLSNDDILNGEWIKVAFSSVLNLPTKVLNSDVRRPGELLNFFSNSKIPWNRPSPLAAMLTSGLLGAGLGYGLGWAGEKVLPEETYDSGKAKKSLAVLGAVLGGALPAAWMGTNYMSGLPINSSELLTTKPPIKTRIDFPEIKAAAIKSFTKKAFGPLASGAAGVEPVNINRLGQTLWDIGATPQTAAATMSSVYAAQQLPGGVGPGYVTPHQTGLLGTMMGAAGGGAKGYAAGWGVGKGLGLLTGMPPSTQKVLKYSGAALGIINTLVPRLFH